MKVHLGGSIKHKDSRKITDCITFISFCPQEASIRSSHFMTLNKLLWYMNLFLHFKYMKSLNQ